MKHEAKIKIQVDTETEEVKFKFDFKPDHNPKNMDSNKAALIAVRMYQLLEQEVSISFRHENGRDINVPAKESEVDER